MGKLKLYKCKGFMQLGSSRVFFNFVFKYYGQGSEVCICDSGDYKFSLVGCWKKFFKKKYKVSYVCNCFICLVVIEVDGRVYYVGLGDVVQF